jgi:hypothetical protein
MRRTSGWTPSAIGRHAEQVPHASILTPRSGSPSFGGSGLVGLRIVDRNRRQAVECLWQRRAPSGVCGRRAPQRVRVGLLAEQFRANHLNWAEMFYPNRVNIRSPQIRRRRICLRVHKSSRRVLD